jgi:2,5-diketo-D-gluconate reductase B
MTGARDGRGDDGDVPGDGDAGGGEGDGSGADGEGVEGAVEPGADASRRGADTAAGTPVPPFGLGTWNVADAECARTVERALAAGYRHLDTAQLYGTERAVGRGLARADVPREEVFLATKVDPERLGPGELAASVAESRERLGVDVLDCVYVHWPRAAYEPAGTLGALEDLVADGAVRGVGLSNFTPDLLAEALEHTDHVVAHQVEYHPLCQQDELLAAARADGHALVAYSPLARGRALELPAVRAVAERRGATPAQVALAWLRAKGAVPIPRGTGAHVEENLGALDVALEGADVARIDAVDRVDRVVDPPSAPWNRDR